MQDSGVFGASEVAPTSIAFMGHAKSPLPCSLTVDKTRQTDVSSLITLSDALPELAEMNQAGNELAVQTMIARADVMTLRLETAALQAKLEKVLKQADAVSGSLKEAGAADDTA